MYHDAGSHTGNNYKYISSLRVYHRDVFIPKPVLVDPSGVKLSLCVHKAIYMSTCLVVRVNFW